MSVIYAAGPISGLKYGESTDWRGELQRLLPDIQVASPMRNKEYLSNCGVIDGSYPEHVMSCDRGIMTRDHYDVRNCDLLVVNLLGATRVSIGTAMELAWAVAYQKPTVVVIEPAGNVHDHPMIREAIGFRVTTLEEAAAVARSVLAPYGVSK